MTIAEQKFELLNMNCMLLNIATIRQPYRGLLRLPQLSTSIMIYEPKNGSQTTGMFQCNKPILTVVLLVLITFMSTVIRN